MKRLVGILVIGIVGVGCGQGVIDEIEILPGDIQSQKDPIVQNTLKIIAMGEIKGDEIMTHQVNKVLQSQGINYFYNGLVTLSADATAPNQPNTDGPANCKYVGNPVAQTTGAVSCRFIANEAMEKAFLAITADVDANRAVQSTEFPSSDKQLADYRTWYLKSVNSTVEITAVRLIDQLRKQGVCDQNPTAKESAYERGVAMGRKLYNEAMNERLKDLGIEFDYPNNNGQKASNSTRYCQATLRQPALSAAVARVSSFVAANPLCEKIGNDPIEQSQLYAAYTTANDEYVQGLKDGAGNADKDAQGLLRKGGCCIASPLVLDLAGDGIAATTKKVKFDLLSTGTKVNTAWISGDDALLTLDRDGNGKIDSAKELFGNDDRDGNGFAKLARFDTNKDGRIDKRDAVYKRLRLWQDANGDGISSSDELSTLSSMGVAAIELRYTSSSQVDVTGSQHRQTARFLRTDEFASALGRVGTVTDVWFTYE